MLALSLAVFVPGSALAGSPLGGGSSVGGEYEEMPEQPTIEEVMSPPTVEVAPPPTGRAMLGLGIVGVVTGTAATVFGMTFLIADPDGVGVFGVAPLTLGAAFVTVGALGIHYGRRRHAALRRWEDEAGTDLAGWRSQHGKGPVPGTGLVVTGSLVGAGGLALLVSSAVIYDGSRHDNRSPRPVVGLGILAGTLGTIAGAMMLGFGSVRVHQHRRKQSARVQLMPVPSFGPRTYGFGVAGRF
ncbi:hypothetical protein [Enhygromyxa salina]|uniref:Uncharacterized protein n=1 Tax=Enhygromyxa salina TaxID=215803 RepID=A0A2S9YWN4_9BACT|nr:hypothetical protein [Enhygromyxa salina]PRQ09506.1 hypothetical protein ENSA7_07480 [Enhygromyxa salina]